MLVEKENYFEALIGSLYAPACIDACHIVTTQRSLPPRDSPALFIAQTCRQIPLLM